MRLFVYFPLSILLAIISKASSTADVTVKVLAFPQLALYAKWSNTYKDALLGNYRMLMKRFYYEVFTIVNEQIKRDFGDELNFNLALQKIFILKDLDFVDNLEKNTVYIDTASPLFRKHVASHYRPHIYTQNMLILFTSYDVLALDPANVELTQETSPLPVAIIKQNGVYPTANELMREVLYAVSGGLNGEIVEDNCVRKLENVEGQSLKKISDCYKKSILQNLKSKNSFNVKKTPMDDIPIYDFQTIKMDHQCEFFYGAGFKSCQAPEVDSDVCLLLFCKKSDDTCENLDHREVNPGTNCGEGLTCVDKQCQ